MTEFFLFITFLGNWETILFLSLIAGIYLVLNKKYKLFSLIAISGLSNLAVIEPLKKIIAEPRPLGGLITETSYSFPSGHSYSAVAFYGLLIYLIYRKTKNKFALIASIIFVLLIAYSRLYLGVHYLHDVLAGLFLGLVWVLAITKNLTRYRHLIMSIMLILIFSFYQKAGLPSPISIFKVIDLKILIIYCLIPSLILSKIVIYIHQKKPKLLVDTTKIVNFPGFPKYFPLVGYPLLSVPLQELIFRWFFVGGILSLTHQPLLTIGISSVIFAIIHLPFSLSMALVTLFTGIWWSTLYVYTSNLWYPIISHAIIGNVLIWLAIYPNKNK